MVCALQECSEVTQFYTASTFALHRTKPITFPSYTMLSENYFNPGWAGDRRLKNVVMVLEWIPSVSKLALLTNMSKSMTDVQQALFKRAFQYFDLWVGIELTSYLSPFTDATVAGRRNTGCRKPRACFAHLRFG